MRLTLHDVCILFGVTPARPKLKSRFRGRGAEVSPSNRFEDIHLTVLGETLDEELRQNPSGRQVRTEVFADASKTIINRVDSPDLNFNWSINPYRGCEHGCVYCYARPTHETLGFSCGLDFETKIMAKVHAPELLRRELAQPSWRGEPIAISGVTDPYQPIERRFNITQQCLEVLAECRQPVTFVTKNHLVTRDIDLLAELARHNAVRVALSVTTLDSKLARTMEPRASRPADRLRAIAELTEAGIPCMAMVAPVIPGLSDREIPKILRAVADAGAVRASWVMLRLPYEVKSAFFDWLDRRLPDRRAKIEHAIRDMRGGALYQSAFGRRQRGESRYAEQISQTFDIFSKRYGLNRELPPLSSESFRRPEPKGQMRLFN